MTLDINNLRVDCFENGEAKVEVWAKCFTSEDIADVIEWLKLAEAMMRKWGTVRKSEP